jgi:hypothetical protein
MSQTHIGRSKSAASEFGDVSWYSRRFFLFLGSFYFFFFAAHKGEEKNNQAWLLWWRQLHPSFLHSFLSQQVYITAQFSLTIIPTSPIYTNPASTISTSPPPPIDPSLSPPPPPNTEEMNQLATMRRQASDSSTSSTSPFSDFSFDYRTQDHPAIKPPSSPPKPINKTTTTSTTNTTNATFSQPRKVAALKNSRNRSVSGYQLYDLSSVHFNFEVFIPSSLILLSFVLFFHLILIFFAIY